MASPSCRLLLAVLLPAVLGLTGAPHADAQSTSDYFLHGTGATANPVTLFLDTTAPASATEKYKDSAGINFNGGNLWKEVGTWGATPVPAPGTLTALTPVHVWLGLKNSDDQGTNFDLLAELYKNGVLVTSGLTRCLTGITRNANQAKEVTVAFGSFAAESLNGTTDTLSLKVWTRIGTNPDNTKCAGHNNAVGLRLYFDAISRSARFGATIGSSDPTPTTLTPNPLTITVGATGTLTATIAPTPATADTLTVTSSNASVATVPATVSFDVNQTSIPVPVTAVGTGNAQITVSLNGGSASSTVQVNPSPPTITSLLPSTVTMTQGGSGTLTVTISAAQGTDTVVVLSSTASGIAAVPATVTVLAGQTSAPITVSANTPGTAQITASLNGSSATSTVTVTPALPTVVSLLPPTNPVTLGASTTLTVTISASQPTDTVVAVSASPAGIVTVPATVTVAAGQTSVPLVVGTVALGQALVQASLNGTTADSAVQVVPPAPALVSLLPSPLTVVVGATGTLTVTLNAAQQTNTVVTVSVDQGGVLQVPATVTVAANQTQASFTVTGIAVGSAIVTVTLGSSTQQATVQVIPPPPMVVSLLPNPLLIQQGATGSFTLTINAAQLADTAIPLTNSAAAVAQAPASATVPAGQTSVTFPVTGLTPGSATVTASINASSVSATVNVTPPPTMVTGLTPATTTVPKGTPAVLHVTVAPTSTTMQTVTLSSNNPAVATVPATVPIPAGALGADFPVMTVGVGTATITASLNGGSASATVVVTPAELVTLTLSPQAPSIYIGQTQPFTTTGTFTDGTTQDLTASVTWTSSDQVVATINASGVASVLAAGTTTITAASGSITTNTTLTVLTPPALSLTPATASLNVGTPLTLTVTSATPAEPGGLTVTLAQSGAGGVVLPGTVLIPEAQSSATFPVTGATAGSVTITATAPIRLPASSTLTIVNPAPTITGFAPTSGKAGDQVTITGVNFMNVQSVAFNGTAATTVTVSSATSLVATVPAGATTGPISVTTAFGTATSTGSFVVIPTQDFQLSVLPAVVSLTSTGQGSFSLGLAGSGGFTGLATLGVMGVPAGATAALASATLTSGQSTLLTLTANGTTPAGSYNLTVTATGLLSGAQASRSAAVLVQVLAGGTTSLTGQVLDEEAKPVKGALVKLGPLSAPTAQATTDDGGNFLMQNPPVGANQLLFIDGGPASTPAHNFPIVPYKVTIVAGQANALGFTPHLHFQKTTGMVDISNSSVQRVVTDPDIPGFQMTIPAGATITGWDGQPNTQISTRRVPIDRIPLPPLPPDRVGVSAYMDYFGKPGGGTPSEPIPITFPNDLGAPPGTQVELWYYDEAPDGSRPNQMAIYGTGTVSADGSLIVPDIDPSTGKAYGQPRFCCGYVMPAWLQAALNFANDLLKGLAVSLGLVTGADPVDLATGQFVLSKTDMVLPGRLPVTVTRTYHSGGTAQGPYGRGTSHSYDVSLLDTSFGLAVTVQRTLFLPGGQQVVWRDQGNGTFRNLTDPAYRGAVLTIVGSGHSLRFKDGAVWTFGAPPVNLAFLTQQTDRNGNTLTFTRTGTLGRLDVITDAAGRQLTFAYDGGSRITSITDPIGRVVRYSYDGSGRLVTVTDPAFGETRYTYDAQGRMLTLTDARGLLFLTNQYDSNGRMLKQTQADGGMWQFAYTTSAGVITQTVVTDPGGKLTTHRFNGQGYPLAQQDGQGQATLTTRNAANQVTKSTDAQGRTTLFTYDAAGNTTSITDPDGKVTSFEYEPVFNRVTKITDALNGVTTFTYDVKGNLLTTTNPKNETTTIAYNSFGQPTSVTDALNQTTTFAYDTAGNLITTADALSNQTQRVYDAVSRLVSLADPRNFSTQFRYDDLNRVDTIADARQGLTGFGYDPNGNLQTVTDTKNQTTTYTYDTMDRLTTRKDALNRTEGYAYDLNGNLTTFTDRKNQVTTFLYDAVNRRSSAVFADGSSTSFTYDAVGRLAAVSDSLSGTITFAYDTLDRLISTTTPQGTVQYTYDALGRRTTMTVNGQAPVTYIYDAASRLIQVAQGSLFVNVAYDAAGRRTTLTYSNGLVASYSYDAASRLLSILHQGPGGVIDSLTYTYDAAGNRLSANRVNSAATQLPTAVTASYDAANEQAQFAGATLQYDANGNLTNDASTVLSTGSATTYTWDARNRLVAISGGVSASFQYDALGRRISKTINGVTTQFLYDGNDIIAELQGGAITAFYLRSLNIDEPFIRITPTGNEYYHTDALGSVLALTNNAGAVQTTYTYEPFGKTTISGVSANPFQYTGRENDQPVLSGVEGGLYYYRARYYSPTLARFTAEDPRTSPLRPPFFVGKVLILPSLSCNLFRSPQPQPYAYVGNNPLLRNDPTGLGGTEACGYYDEQCDRSTRKGNPDQYACLAGDCCRDFGEGPSTNEIRDCLINIDHVCAKLPADLRVRCRELSHAYCYSRQGRQPETWPPPSSCKPLGLFGGVLAPFFRTNGRRKRRLYVTALFLAPLLLIGLRSLIGFVFSILHEFSFLARSLFTFPLALLINLYAPGMFWIITWARRRYREAAIFPEGQLGWVTMSIGAGFIAFAQGPAFFVNGWLQGPLADIYTSFYAMGWSFVLGGLFAFPAVRMLFRRHFWSVASLVIGVAWWFIGPLRREIVPLSFVWPIASILSLLVAFLGILACKVRYRVVALIGLVSMTLYSFAGPVGWFPIMTAADPRFMGPMIFAGCLAWMATLGWLTGILRRFGNPLEQ